MSKMRFPTDSLPRRPRRVAAFTRVDLIATVLMLMTLGLLAVPRLARASMAALGITCVDNQRLAVSAWQQYAADHSDHLVNNFTIPEVLNTINNGKFDTWALNILDWTTASANTNLTQFQNGKLFPYLQGNTSAFKCPADNFLSSAQIAKQWSGRIRSYSMNNFMGKNSASDSATNSGLSGWVSGKRQFLKTAGIPNPGNTIVFLDEHPDSINDGFFIENESSFQWSDLPASHHNGGCGFGFADGHGEIHLWTYNGTKVPVRYNFTGAPPITTSTRGDFLWVTSRMTVDPTALAVNRRANGAEIAWSALSTNYVLEANSDISTPNWVPVEPKPVTDFGTKSVTVDVSSPASFFRLHKY